MGCRAVSQTMRTDVGRIGHQRDPGVHHSTHRPLVEAPATRAEEQGRATVGGRQARSPNVMPALNRLYSRDAEGDGPLLVPLAQHPHDVARLIDVVDIKSHQLTHPNTRGVQNFEHRIVTQLLGVNLIGRSIG